MEQPSDSWPTRRGFDRFYGTLEGAGSFYQPRTLHDQETRVDEQGLEPGFFYTDAITEHAVGFVEEHAAERPEQPLFLYLAHTAPHWPLHAAADDIAAYDARFDAGWDALRAQRLERLVEEGIVEPDQELAARDPRVPAWDDSDHHAWEVSRMATYAAQISRMDAGVGEVLDALERAGRLDDTLVVFLSDNGGCAEELDHDFVTAFVPMKDQTRDGEPVTPGNVPGLAPGPESTYMSYGRSWAHLSNTPFREYKHWVHEGGIATPLLVRWPTGLAGAGDLVRTPGQLVDLLPTFLDAAGASYPATRAGHDVPPAEGVSLLPAIRGEELPERDLVWEHEGNSAIRRGGWKLVRKHGQGWELYAVDTDRAEAHDLSGRHPDVVTELSDAYDDWARRCGVVDHDRTLALYAARGKGLPPE